MRVVDLHGAGRRCAELESFVYCGRTCAGFAGSPLANPFKLGRDGDLDAVLTKYRRWLWGCLQDKNSKQTCALIELHRDSVLGCWCVSKVAGTGKEQCHCDVIAKAYNWLLHQCK